MKKRKVNLYPKAGGKCLEFESIAEAAEFLHRDTCYMSTRYTKGLCVSDNYTLEKYVIDILGDQKKSEVQAKKKGHQLCGFCKNFAYGCEWSERGEPVPGWTATPTVIKADRRHRNVTKEIKSFSITACPKFVEG